MRGPSEQSGGWEQLAFVFGSKRILKRLLKLFLNLFILVHEILIVAISSYSLLWLSIPGWPSLQNFFTVGINSAFV